MKKNLPFLLYGLCFTFLAVISGCVEGIYCERGSGSIASENREIKNFTGIRLEGSANLVLSQGPTESVRIETDNNILPMITTKLSKGDLVISNDKSICPTRLNIYVTVKDLKRIVLEGSGNITGITPFNTSDLGLIISGSGNIRMENITTEELNLMIEGSGNINITGSTDLDNISVDGSGDINSFDMKSKSTVVVINGSGNCRVFASEKLVATINGSGDIYYKGKPKDITTSINGSGTVKPVE